ncbi:MAG TPA: ester cyclase [Vicinamibacterales bacterium]
MPTNSDVIRAFVDALNAHDWDALDRLVAPDFVRHSAAAGKPGVRSRDDLKAYLRRELETFPDAREEILDIFGERDRVAVRHRFSGTQRGRLGPHPATDRRMTSEYLAIYRLESGLIVEAWAEWDNASSLRQLGLVE